MLKLSRTQEKIVRQKNVGTFVIKGEKYSGKTSIAIIRMLYLLEHACKAGERILYICMDEASKQKVNQQFSQYYGLQNISLFDEESKGEVIIKSIDYLLQEAANKAHVHLNLEICNEVTEDLLVDLLPQVRKAYPKVKWLREEYLSFMAYEIRWIYACGYTSFEQYAGANRKRATMKLPKKGSGRRAIWFLKELVSSNLKKQGFMMKDQMQMDTLSYLQEDTLREQYRHIIIDDAHKLTKVQLECIKALKSKDHGEILFLMDKSEKNIPFSWLGQGNSFKTIGYNMTGRVKHLVKRKKAHTQYKKKVGVKQTPLELFMQEMNQHVHQEQKMQVAEKTLPWYVETYRYVNKITGVETIFQRDSSAGETYIDEVKQDEVEALPIYSNIAAGMPIELVDEVNGKFELPSLLLHHKKDTYILHVQGDSMIGVEISDGDYVVIQAGNINNYEIAAVYYNGAVTLKRIVQEKEHILLVSENPEYSPIVIEEGDFRVMGKLIGVIKPIIEG